jgi:hypothetical protein
VSIFKKKNVVRFPGGNGSVMTHNKCELFWTPEAHTDAEMAINLPYYRFTLRDEYGCLILKGIASFQFMVGIYSNMTVDEKSLTMKIP